MSAENKNMSEQVVESNPDSESQRRTYEAVMRFSSQFGVPFAIALTMFFTNLVMGNGVQIAIVAAIATHLFVFFIVKAFFSH
ncbi:MAG: hypothetical protein AAF742_02620 [Pseudomonadota bacterium]